MIFPISKRSKHCESIGKIFNYLTITQIYRKRTQNKKDKYYCLCNCKCGKIDVEKRLDNVVSNRVPSCGCISHNRPNCVGQNNHAFKGIGQITGVFLFKLKRQAKRRGIEFNLTKEYIWCLYLEQAGLCKISGIPIKFGRVYFTHETTASLDRINSNLPYQEGNVQWVHKDVNKLKGSFQQDYLIKLCHLISDHNKP